MPIPEIEKDRKTKEQIIVQEIIKAEIRKIRNKQIMIIIGSGLISYLCYLGSKGIVESNYIAGNILYLLGAASAFLLFTFSILICTDFRNYSRDALDDWEKFLGNEEAFWEKHKKVIKIQGYWSS